MAAAEVGHLWRGQRPGSLEEEPGRERNYSTLQTQLPPLQPQLTSRALFAEAALLAFIVNMIFSSNGD